MKIGHVFSHRLYIRVALLLGVWTAAPTLRVQAQSLLQQEQVTAYQTLIGRVVDADGKPINKASVKLQARNGWESRAVTDLFGRFTFQALRLGGYEVSAEKSGVRSATISVELEAGILPPVEIVLRHAHGGAIESTSKTSGADPEFSDKPNFTVAGVTDWTAIGGHGSDVTLRTSEDLTRETLMLPARGSSRKATSGEDRIQEATEESALRAGVAASPRSYAANRKLGEFYLRVARYEQAIGPLKIASDLNQAKAADEFNLAVACQGLGDFPQARQHVARALSQQDAAEFHRLAGEVDEKLGDPMAALQQEELAVRIAPNEENYFAWGSELLLHRAIWQAVEVFADGAKAHPSSAQIRTGWGAALFAGARYEEAARRLCEASDLDPADIEPYLFIGKIVLAAPSPLMCVEQKLARFVQRQPDDADANYFYAMLLLKQGSTPNLSTATSLLRKAVSINAQYADAYLQLGILAFQERRYSDAINLYIEAVEANPQQAEAHYRLGVAYDRAGNFEQAQKQFELHDQLNKALADKVEKQRREVKQFVILPMDSPPTP